MVREEGCIQKGIAIFDWSPSPRSFGGCSRPSVSAPPDNAVKVGEAPALHSSPQPCRSLRHPVVAHVHVHMERASLHALPMSAGIPHLRCLGVMGLAVVLFGTHVGSNWNGRLRHARCRVLRSRSYFPFSWPLQSGAPVGGPAEFHATAIMRRSSQLLTRVLPRIPGWPSSFGASHFILPTSTSPSMLNMCQAVSTNQPMPSLEITCTFSFHCILRHNLPRTPSLGKRSEWHCSPRPIGPRQRGESCSGLLCPGISQVFD